MSMATIDLDNLQATDITPTLNALAPLFHGARHYRGDG
jgi:hypothetical protein